MSIEGGETEIWAIFTILEYFKGNIPKGASIIINCFKQVQSISIYFDQWLSIFWFW